MTYWRNSSMVSLLVMFSFLPSPRWGEGFGVRGEVVQSPHPPPPSPAGRGALEHNLRPDAAVGVDLQQQRMPQSAVDNVRLLDAAAQPVEARLHLRDHPLFNDAAADQLVHLRGVEAAYQRLRIGAVHQDAWRIRQ